MVIKKYIQKTLHKLNRKHRYAMLSNTPEEAIYYSKLSILEYCGWIEESMDIIVKRSVKKKIRTVPYMQILDNAILGGTHGFEYVKHFRPMLMRAIGIQKMEKIEINLINNGQLDLLKSELLNVKQDRDDAAHTWINNVTKTYPAPSIAQNRLKLLFPILRGIYSQIL